MTPSPFSVTESPRRPCRAGLDRRALKSSLHGIGWLLALGAVWLGGCTTAAQRPQVADRLPDYTVTDPQTGCRFMPKERGGNETCLHNDFPDRQQGKSVPPGTFDTLKAAEFGTVGRWVELESDRPTRRYYVAITGQSTPSRLPIMHLRYDVSPDERQPSPAENMGSLIRTLALDCTQGEQTDLAIHVFDKRGAWLNSHTVEAPKAERILHFYQSPLRHVCRGDYLQSRVDGGDALAADMRKRIAEEQRRRVPDLSIAVPPVQWK